MPRSGKIFISHASEDGEVAAVLADIIKRTTLEQLEVWFSSDQTTTGGIRAGEVWRETLLERLQSCDVLLVVLTPNSINHPWVYFESGIAAAGPATKIVPVCVGVDPTKLSLPLGFFQAYLGSTPAGLAHLVARLCQVCGAKFDGDMAKPLIEKAALGLGEKRFIRDAAAAALEPTASRAIQDHLDKRFYELTELLRGRVASPSAASNEYTITLRIAFPERRKEQLMVVSGTMTIQHVLDQMYALLQGLVEPYMYLQSWCLLRHPDLRPLITAAGGRDDMPASAFLPPNTIWEAHRLKEPFTFGQQLSLVRSTPDGIRPAPTGTQRD